MRATFTMTTKSTMITTRRMSRRFGLLVTMPVSHSVFLAFALFNTSLSHSYFADVGGGSVPTETLHSLANPSFKWMINQIIAHTNIKFVGGMFDSTLPGSIRGFHASMSDRPALPSSFLQGPAQTSDSYHFEEPSTATTAVPPSTPPTTSKPFVKPTSPIVQQYKRQQTLEGPGSSHLLSVAQSDPVKDATAEKFDQLVKNPIWKILEYMLLWEYTQDPVTGVWSRRLRYVLRPR